MLKTTNRKHINMVIWKHNDWKTFKGTWLIASSVFNDFQVMWIIASDVDKYGSLNDWTKCPG